MMIFKDHGYSPNNFASLVAASGCKSNSQFFKDNDIKERMFYRYLDGTTSINWVGWQKLVKKYEVNNGKA